ncbi:hypothetical protein MMC08_008553 [Hypocenomyce scalaris]|nr:hypothetical protein [Hypocenomyce scalaris]
MASSSSSTSPSDHDLRMHHLYRTFITACHILHHYNVLETYGHLSVRHPFHTDRFIMARYIAPAVVMSERDLVEYYISDASPVDPSAPSGYSERYIHSEVLKRFPSVNAVIHSHDPSIVPYSVSGVPFRAIFHTAGFLGSKPIPIFDIADHYQQADRPDLLVRNSRLGAALAACFSSSSSSSPPSHNPDHVVVLMRGHGLTLVAESIEDAVLRAVYTQKNAQIQTAAITLRGAYFGQGEGSEVRFLSDAEAEAAGSMPEWGARRPWKLWVREVEAAGLYVNTAV